MEEMNKIWKGSALAGASDIRVSSDGRYSELAWIYGALPIHDRKEW